MRIVAFAILTLLVVAAVHTQAAPYDKFDDCKNELSTTGGQPPCLKIDVRQRSEAAASAAGIDTAYLIIDPTARTTSSNAAGTPATIPLLFQESNGYPGLQLTKRFTVGWEPDADMALLI